MFFQASSTKTGLLISNILYPIKAPYSRDEIFIHLSGIDILLYANREMAKLFLVSAPQNKAFLRSSIKIWSDSCFSWPSNQKFRSYEEKQLILFSMSF